MIEAAIEQSEDEAAEFTDELTDEALDGREPASGKACICSPCCVGSAGCRGN